MIYYPHRLLLQWHITNRCNLRCTHCYQESYSGPEPDFRELLGVLDQFENFLCLPPDKNIRGHITLTGGEPFLRKDIFDLLAVFSRKRRLFSFGILSNGTLIDDRIAKYLRQIGTAFVQVSVEGTEKTHDAIRGPGSFAQTVQAIRCLVRAKVRTLISFTAHQTNFREFPAVALLGRKLRVARVWSDRFIPQGQAETEIIRALTPEETREWITIIDRERRKASRVWFGRTEIAAKRALQFLVSPGQPYHCTAGDTLLTIMPNGDMYPCRRMPVRIGNISERPLEKLYRHELLCTLRDRDRVPENCRDCIYVRLCRGGLRCMSLAVTGDPFQADPGCWYV